jgi:hypothetical protein
MEDKQIVNKGEAVRQTIFLILILILIVTLIVAVIRISKYADMLSNPLGYNLKQFNIDYCTCFYNNGEPVVIRSTNSTLNLSNFNNPINSNGLQNLNITIKK